MTHSRDKKLDTPLFFDGDLSLLDGTIAIIGYGNQGQAQAQNLRDSGLSVIIGNREDEYRAKAISDSFDVVSIQKAAERAKFILLLIPDEVQACVFEESIKPVLTSGMTLCFASGFNISFGLIRPPPETDVIMVAPRMIGIGVRKAFEEERGFFTFMAVERDYSGRAKQLALALAKGIGSMKPGGAVIEVTFRQEAELDLYNEQCFGPAFGQVLTAAVDVAIEAGYPPEAVLIEIYMSGELSFTIQKIAEMGTFRQLALHSPASQYGSMSRSLRYVNPELRDQMRETLLEIQDGSFAKEFIEEYESGMETLKDMKEMAQDMPIVYFDEQVRQRLRLEQIEETKSSTKEQ
jgi:ketol-acid reductoisomerase